MSEKEWQGKKDPRLYWKMREEKKEIIREKYERLRPYLNERVRRLWAANETISFGAGGVRAVAEALQMSSKTIVDGKRELKGEDAATWGQKKLLEHGSGDQEGDENQWPRSSQNW